MKNYAFKLAGEFGVRLLSTIFLLVLARMVGASDFGIYSTAFAFASIFLILVDLGTNPIVTREIARSPQNRPQIIASVTYLKTITAIFMLVCLAVVGRAVQLPWEKARLVHWFGWVVIGTAFTEYYSAIFTGLEQMAAEAVLKVVCKGIVILAALFILLHTHNVLPTVKMMGLSSIASVLIGTLIVRYRIGKIGFTADWIYLKRLLTQSLPIFGSLAFLTLYDSQDILILNFFKVADHRIGLFALAVKIIDVLKIFPVLLASAYFPSLARQAHLSRRAFIERAKELLSYAAFGLPLLTAIMYILAPTIIRTLYGRTYLEAVPALRLLLIGFLVMAFNVVLLQLLIALDREKESFVSSMVVCLTNLVVSAYLVPRYDMLGTCYALIASEVFYLFVQGYLVKQAYSSLTEKIVLPEAKRGLSARCSIIIPTYNTRELTLACLSRIRENPPPHPYEIIVIDNHSSDGTYEMVQEIFPEVMAIRNNSNLGFARACNQGARMAKGDFFLFLNSDTEPLPGSFDVLLDWMKKHPHTGIVGPELMGPSQTLLQMSWGWDPLLGREFIQRYFSSQNIRPSLFKQHLIRYLQRKPRSVPFICGACLMIRREVFEQINGFDENFEFYFEDSDLCSRCLQTGWQIDFVPHSTIIHHLGQSTKGTWNMASLIYQQSHITYYKKHAPPWSIIFLKGYLLFKWVRIWLDAQLEKREQARAKRYCRWYLRMIFESMKFSLDDELAP
jgi:GT2 family glycosyltransferase/O-antigen/teichoic acid export membrane protein